ncbi:MAG: MarR family winged helix-turn-helix transcriptional regulator [Pseudomonadales bacterium]
MNMPATRFQQHEDLWRHYRSNLPRHLLGLSRYLQATLMHALIEKLGYRDLRLSYEPFITLVGDRGARLTELAGWLGISKQAVNQTANQIEHAGYIARTPDPADGRAKVVVLTAAGRKLVNEGSALIGDVEQKCIDLLGKRKTTRLSKHLAALYLGVDLPRPRVTPTKGLTPVMLGGLLPRIADYMMQRLMHLTDAYGHPHLKMSYAHVLTLIGPDGGRIQQMARIQEVSKQAISTVASELELLGYIRRAADPQDARRVLLQLTEEGWQLLAHSVTAVGSLEQEMALHLRDDGLTELKLIAAELYSTLHLEEEVFEPSHVPLTSDLQKLASQLRSQLGRKDTAELARLLKQQ